MSEHITILPATMPFIPVEDRSRLTVYISDALLLDEQAATDATIAQMLLPIVESGVRLLREQLALNEEDPAARKA